MKGLGNIVALTSSLLIGLGCSDFEGGDDVRSPDDDMVDVTTAAQEPAGADWGCLDDVAGAVPVAPNRDSSITFSILVYDGATGQPPPNLRVRACNNFDPSCSDPAGPEVRADADGLVSIDLVEGFPGFLELESDTTMPAMLFMPGPLLASWRGPALFLVTPASLALLGQLNGVDVDPERSTLGAIALDCQGKLAAGVAFGEDSQEGIPYYFVNLRPTRARADTAADGSGGFVNVPPDRQIIMRGVVTAMEREIAAVPVTTRPGWLSLTFLTKFTPAPAP